MKYEKTKAGKAREAEKFARSQGWSEVADLYWQANHQYESGNYVAGNKLMDRAIAIEDPLLKAATKKAMGKMYGKT